MDVCSILSIFLVPAHRLASLNGHQVRADKHVLQIVVPTLTPGATMLALHYVLSNLQNTIRARHIALAPSGSAAYLGSSHCTPLLQTC